jgi:Fe-S-cluster containining protein
VLFSQDQHFTCSQCGRCCRRTTVPITAGEADSYRKAGVARWFTGDEAFGNSARDPFEPIPGHAPLLRIRKRRDGACGFLSPEGLCRIHEAMGADRKPIACRLFPFRFHPADDVLVTTSFACPSIVANEGAPLRLQARELRVLHAAWNSALPEAAARVELVAGHTLSPPVLAALRRILAKVVDRPDEDGHVDLRSNLRRIAAFLEDLSRRRVRQLAPEAFAEYVDLMGRYAATNQTPAATRPPSRLTRLLFRGFLLATLSVQERLDAHVGTSAFTLRVALFRLLAHLHGLAPGTARFSRHRAMTTQFPMDDEGVTGIAHRYLRTSFETLGTGRRPVVDEVAMIVAHLNAACALAGMHAATNGKRAVDGESFAYGLLEASDLAHADDGGTLSGLLTTLSGGVEALYLFPPMYSYAHG